MTPALMEYLSRRFDGSKKWEVSRTPFSDVHIRQLTFIPVVYEVQHYLLVSELKGLVYQLYGPRQLYDFISSSHWISGIRTHSGKLIYTSNDGSFYLYFMHPKRIEASIYYGFWNSIPEIKESRLYDLPNLYYLYHNKVKQWVERKYK